ncbi:YibE/F family protein [Candidatus Uhrbacteria bacterium]|nr:YibE/F family protein [Candidatus Uhrbacteria bacterium]
MQKKISLFFIVGMVGVLAVATIVSAQDIVQDESESRRSLGEGGFPPDEYYKGTVIKILTKEDRDYIPSSDIVQKLRVRIEDGVSKGIEVGAENNIPTNSQKGTELAVGDMVVLVATYGVEGRMYYVTDRYRFSALGMLAAIFIVFVLIFGRLRGLSSLIGLAFSICVIAFFIVPQILRGTDPLTISLIGSLVIACISLYLAHGFSVRTSIALGGTLITLLFSALCSILFVGIGKLFGAGNEDALFLQLQDSQAINLRGLLLGGMIIGILGILDDITTAQTAAVDEIQKANPKLSRKELYARGISVGREHITSLVNTLALAYAGVSLPLFLLFILNKGQPLWVILNGEPIAEEVIRTLVGSLALIVAVPLTTFLAVEVYHNRRTHEV